MAIELVVTQPFGLPQEPAEEGAELAPLKMFGRGDVIDAADEMGRAQEIAPHCVVRRTKAEAPTPREEPAPPTSPPHDA